jgi:hypothetical protein
VGTGNIFEAIALLIVDLCTVKEAEWAKLPFLEAVA